MHILDGRNAFTQWDKDVKITADDLRDGDEIHFSNGTTQNALVVKAKRHGYEIVVDVPNTLLTTQFPIKAYRYIKSKDGSYTIKKHIFEVKRRPKPEDYVYTETERFTVEKAVAAALNEAKESGKFDGKDGLTPYINDGNWWIGDEDTGVSVSSGATTQIIDIDIALTILDNATGRFSVEMSDALYDDLDLRIYYMYERPDGYWSETDDWSFTVPAGEVYVDYAFETEGIIIGVPYITFFSEQYNPHIQVIDEHHLRYYEERTIVDASVVMVGGEPVALESHLNEVEIIAKGAQRAISFSDYRTFINKFNNALTGDYSVGQSIMIVTLNVPNLWVSADNYGYKRYTYVSDEKFVEELMTNGKVQVGRYMISALETQKVNLADYYDKGEIDGMIGDISTALDTLHEYAQSLVSGGESE